MSTVGVAEVVVFRAGSVTLLNVTGMARLAPLVCGNASPERPPVRRVGLSGAVPIRQKLVEDVLIPELGKRYG